MPHGRKEKVMTQFLRHKTKGTIYSWNTQIAKNPDVEAITEEEAFPERFISKEVKARKPKVLIDQVVVEEPPPIEFPEINADATRGLKT
jgi:hypothetical protein